MAIIRTSSIVAAISGSIGGQTFVTGKNGTFARIRGYKSPRKSETLAGKQANFKRIVNAWRGLTAQDRAAWGNLARTFPRSNRLGQASPLSGYQLFIKQVLLRAGNDNQLHTFLPFIAETAIVTAVTTTAEGANEPTVFVTTESPNPVSSVRVYGARNLSTIQPKFVKNWRLVFATIVDAGGPEQIFWGDRWTETLGDLLTDETYAVRVSAYEIVNELTIKPGLLAFGQQGT